MIRLLSFVVLVLAAPANAAPVVVQSGEHVDFSRLVLGFDGSAGWRLGRVSGGYEFRTDTDVSFDTGRIFDLIPRTRLTDVTSPSGGVLRLATGCVCHIDAFEMRRGRIVIDVKDGPATPDSDFERPLETARPEPVQIVVDTPAAGGPAEDLPPLSLANLPHTDLPQTPALIQTLADAGVADRAGAFQAELLQQLARAGGQGLVVAAEPAALKMALRNADDPLPSPPGTETPHAEIETAIDRDTLGATPAGAKADGGACPPEALLDLPAWGHLTGGLPDLPAYRAGVVDERDRFDVDRLRGLSRYYLWLTFGAEARSLLALLPANDPTRPSLMAMAEIMDHEGSAPTGAALDGFESCVSPAALWAVLAGPALAPGQAVNERAVVAAFTALPPHVRRLLGPRLVLAFTAVGKLETASILRNALDGPGAEPADVAIAKARLDTALGDPGGAAERLDRALSSSSPGSPDGLLALAETRLSAGEAPDAGLVSALDAVAYEQRDSPVARRIALVLVQAHLSRGEARAARDIILTSIPPDGPDTAAGLLRQVYKTASDDTNPVEFLRLTLPQPVGLGREPLDQPVRLAVARRLLALGFAEDALAVAGDATDHDGRILMARADLALRRPAAALAVLASLTGPDALDLSAQASEANGAFADAASVREPTGKTEATAPLRALGPPAAEDKGSDPDPYAAARRLLAASEEDRATIGTFLAQGGANGL